MTLLNVSSHPGNHEGSDSYFMHCLEAAQPTVTFLGTVCERGGQQDGSTLLHYRLQSTFIIPLIEPIIPSHYSPTFKNGQCWVNFPLLSTNAQIFITSRIFRKLVIGGHGRGRTLSTSTISIPTRNFFVYTW